MAKESANQPQINANPEVDPRQLMAALQSAQMRNDELMDLVTRLNRNLRQLEEQNQLLLARLQSEK